MLFLLAQPAQAATIVAGVQLTVNPDDTVTVTSNGTSQFFGNVGSAGNFGFVGGWGASSDQITWRDTMSTNIATLNAGGLQVLTPGGTANGSILGLLELSASSELGNALVNQFGEGRFAFSSLAVETPTTEFYFEGSAMIVTVPEPAPSLLGAAALAVLFVLRSVRKGRI